MILKKNIKKFLFKKLEDFFEKWIQLQGAKNRKDNISNCKKNIKEKIDNLDKCFTDYAPRIQEPTSIDFYGLN